MRFLANNAKHICRNFFTGQKGVIEKGATRKFVKVITRICQRIDEIQYIGRCTNTFRRQANVSRCFFYICEIESVKRSNL